MDLRTRLILALVSTLFLIEIPHAHDVVGDAIPAILREPLTKRACNSETYRCADMSAKECKSFASRSFASCPVNISVVNAVYREGSESNWDAFIKELQSLNACFSVEFSVLLAINGANAECISTAVWDSVKIEDDGEESKPTEPNMD